MEWTRGPVIGRGSSAAVSLATTATGQLLAVKSADISTCSSLRNEQHLISQLSSPFIIKCFGTDITREKDKSVYNIFLEYVAGGTLSDLIRNQGGSLHESAIKFYTGQMVKGLNYLHLLGFVHCDIKGQNLLIGEDGLTMKIADFGCAKLTECGSSATPTFAGTPAYMAPEVARGEEQGFPSDVWALGCTVVEMATGSNPWPEMKDPASTLYRVAYSHDVPDIPSWLSDAAKDFLMRCFTRDSRERWTAAELLQHPFLNSVEANCSGIMKSTKKSPTSVMDQHFWDAVGSSTDPTENLDSPADRIRELIGDEVFLSNSDFTEWAALEEEDWVVVRGTGSEECGGVEVQIEEMDQLAYENLIHEDYFTVSGIGEEDIETAIVVEDSISHSFRDEISDIDIGAFQFILGDSDIVDSVSTTVTFEIMAMKDSFSSDQISLHSPYLSLSLPMALFFALLS